MSSRGFVQFEGLDPHTGEAAEFRIERSRISQIQRYHPGNKLYDLYCVEQIAKAPAAGFEGLRTVDQKFGDPRQFIELPDPEGICLVGIPSKRSLEVGIVPPPAGYTFAVFADRRRTIFDWAWIRSDPEEANLPIGWRDRFNRRIWPKT